MKNKGLAALAFLVVLSASLVSTGCTCKKHLATIADQEVRLGEANGRIENLQRENGDLNTQLGETRSALEAAQAKGAESSAAVESMTGRILALEAQKAELEKGVAAGKVSEEAYKKRTRSLNASIADLNATIKDKEAAIASGTAEISSLQSREAALRSAVDEREKQISALSGEKDGLSATVASRGRLNVILAILLGVAVLVAVFALFKGGKRASAG